MDARGARHLQARLAVGAAPGERVVVVSISGEQDRLAPGDAGTVVSIGESTALVRFDSGGEISVNPQLVRLRLLTPPG